MTSVAFSPDGSKIVTTYRDKTARIWDVPTGKEINTLSDGNLDITSASFTPNGLQVMAVLSNNSVRIWNVGIDTMTPKHLLEDACKSYLEGKSLMTRDEMRLAGYPDSGPLIDVCAGVTDARP